MERKGNTVSSRTGTAQSRHSSPGTSLPDTPYKCYRSLTVRSTATPESWRFRARVIADVRRRSYCNPLAHERAHSPPSGAVLDFVAGLQPPPPEAGDKGSRPTGVLAASF